MTDVSDDPLPEWTAEELALLRTAADDRPPARSLSASLAAVGAGGAVTSVAAAAKGASLAGTKVAGLVVVSKWVGVVALGGVMVTGGVALVQRAEMASKSEPVAVRAPAETVVAPEAPAAPVSSAVVEAPAAPSASGRSAVVRSQPDISSEIAAVDEARRVLRAGRPAEALSLLDRHDARFGRGAALGVEATALRIEALIQTGNRSRATALANAFLARHPKSPYAARVRALIGEKMEGQNR